MKRIKMIIQYLGTNYAGWQVQPNRTTIQGEIQKAIEQGLGEKVEIFGSGRTDAGVHAFGQVAHFDTNTRINSNNLYSVINRFLPKDIKILSTEQVDNDFHARFDVKQKTYEYHFYCSTVNLPLLDITHARVRFPFDFNEALIACKAFIGTHDFKGFCGANSKVKDTVRTIYSIWLSVGVDNTYCLSVTGNGFLYNMVRIIAGTIIEVGCGQIKVEDMESIIASGQRDKAGKTAQPCGLILKEVNY